MSHALPAHSCTIFAFRITSAHIAAFKLINEPAVLSTGETAYMISAHLNKRNEEAKGTQMGPVMKKTYVRVECNIYVLCFLSFCLCSSNVHVYSIFSSL